MRYNAETSVKTKLNLQNEKLLSRSPLDRVARPLEDPLPRGQSRRQLLVSINRGSRNGLGLGLIFLRCSCGPGAGADCGHGCTGGGSGKSHNSRCHGDPSGKMEPHGGTRPGRGTEIMRNIHKYEQKLV